MPMQRTLSNCPSRFLFFIDLRSSCFLGGKLRFPMGSALLPLDLSEVDQRPQLEGLLLSLHMQFGLVLVTRRRELALEELVDDDFGWALQLAIDPAVAYRLKIKKFNFRLIAFNFCYMVAVKSHCAQTLQQAKALQLLRLLYLVILQVHNLQSLVPNYPRDVRYEIQLEMSFGQLAEGAHARQVSQSAVFGYQHNQSVIFSAQVAKSEQEMRDKSEVLQLALVRVRL